MRATPTTLLAATCAAATLSCGAVYKLPEPPPASEQGPVALDPSEERQRSEARYIEARRTLVALYAALDGEEWDAAVELLSHETRLLLASGGSGSDVEALAAGAVTVDGVRYAFDPVDLFLLADPEGFEDSLEDEEEAETGRRKEVFVVRGDEHRRVVVIDEGGSWRLHMRRWPIELLRREGA